MIDNLKSLFLRDLSKVKAELTSYPSEASLYLKPEGIPNSGGVLIHHIAGNLRHFFGAVIAQDGYIREREAEFNAQLSIPELLQALAAAGVALEKSFDILTPEQMLENYPIEVFGGQILSTQNVILNLLGHLNYHLGQINYHRRLIQHFID